MFTGYEPARSNTFSASLINLSPGWSLQLLRRCRTEHAIAEPRQPGAARDPQPAKIEVFQRRAHDGKTPGGMFSNDGNCERQPAGVDRIHVAHRQVVRGFAAKIERVQNQIETAAGRARYERRRARARQQVALVIAHEQVDREREKNGDGNAENQNDRLDFVKTQIMQRQQPARFSSRGLPAAKSRQLMTRGKRAAISVS